MTSRRTGSRLGLVRDSRVSGLGRAGRAESGLVSRECVSHSLRSRSHDAPTRSPNLFPTTLGAFSQANRWHIWRPVVSLALQFLKFKFHFGSTSRKALGIASPVILSKLRKPKYSSWMMPSLSTENRERKLLFVCNVSYFICQYQVKRGVAWYLANNTLAQLPSNDTY